MKLSVIEIIKTNQIQNLKSLKIFKIIFKINYKRIKIIIIYKMLHKHQRKNNNKNKGQNKQNFNKYKKNTKEAKMRIKIIIIY